MSANSTFIAALRSVGTAATLASAGFYLHRRGFVTAEGKTGFARLSEQVTIPCLFFSKIVNCPQNFSEDKCPSITDNLANIWVLLFWPLFVVGMGIMVGNIAATVSGTPRRQRKAVIAAVAFANSTGLCITLLTVVHANFPQDTELGRVDPNLFLSVYLILYPVLQWGIGGWLLAPGENEDDVNDSFRTNGIHHVLNMPEAEETVAIKSKAAARMIKELSLSSIVEWQQLQDSFSVETTQMVPINKPLPPTLFTDNETAEFVSIDRPLSSTLSSESLTVLARDLSNDVAPLMETMAKIIPRALKPPVIGALSGIFIACIPALRGLLVDLETRSDNAPLEWFFDGIHEVRSCDFLACSFCNKCMLTNDMNLYLIRLDWQQYPLICAFSA
jgi:predicted permease